MLVNQDELHQYLGYDLHSLQQRVTFETLESLRDIDKETRRKFGLPLLDYLFLSHQIGNRGLFNLSLETGIDKGIIYRIFDFFQLPRLTVGEMHKRHWEDPEFRKNVVEKISDAVRDPEYRRKQSIASQRNWEDPEFVRKQSEGVKAKWRDPEFKSKISFSRKEKWEDPNYRQAVDPISGYRDDIGFDAKSAWEANFARILILLNRNFYTRRRFQITVDDEYRHLFDKGTVYKTIDFVVIRPNGKTVFYDMMKDPTTDPASHAKIKMLRRQYPNYDIRTIGERFYHKLRRRFQDCVDKSEKLIGWETSINNLRTNPSYFHRTPVVV